MSDLTRHPALSFSLLGDLVDHGEQRTPYHTRWPAMAASLVGLAAASANRYAVSLGGSNLIALNIYAALVGETGDGKDSSLRYGQLVAAAGGIEPTVFSSDVALHATLASKSKNGIDPRARIVTWDEFGHALAQIKADKAGHQRAMLTKLMEVRGLAVGGVLPERRYAKDKDNLPAVIAPYVCALFTTTPGTLHAALTSADVTDGSLNRITTWFLEPAPLRDVGEIVSGPLPQDLALRLNQLRPRCREVEGAERAPGSIFKPTEMIELPGPGRTVGAQHFKIIEVEPAALERLLAFRRAAEDQRRSGGRLSPIWARAFENSVKLAGLAALGAALGDLGPCQPVVDRDMADWGVALVERSLDQLGGDLRENLSSHEAERIQNSVLHCARKLTEKALAEPNPTVESAAPQQQQEEIRRLKMNGWFAHRDLIRTASGGARSSADVKKEISTLIEGERLAMAVVQWGKGMVTTKRIFYAYADDYEPG